MFKTIKDAVVNYAYSIPKPISDEKWAAMQNSMYDTMDKVPGKVDKAFSKMEKVIESIPAPKWMHTLEAKQEAFFKHRAGKE